jgi:hypothetical protein
MRTFLVLGLMILPGAAWADSCVAPAGAAAGAELALQPSRLAWAPTGQAALSVDAVLAREAFSRCQQQRLSMGSGYQKQTEFDNTPYRFNMKPGQKLSADEFDAWMASRGIRIVRAKTDFSGPAAAPVAEQVAAPLVAD